jgi:diguanylate cyclase (GGDEF)-like protein/PAS domain S-box-containing protein
MSNNKLNTEKFLVVDDEKLMRESVQELLLLNGFNCTLASNGREALQLLSEQSFDIMLLDLIMPEIDGYQVMQKVQFKYPDLDIIITSGEATFNNASQAMRHGVKAFLDKPYQPNDLVKILSDLIEKKAIKRNLEEIQNQIVNSEQRYRLFIEHSPDVIFMLDASGNMSFINSRAMELLNYTQAEFLGSHYSEFIHGDDLEKAHFIFSTHLSNIDTPHTVELRIYTEASKNQFLYFEIRSIATKLDINDNESIGIYGVARDITEKKHLDEMLAFNLYHDALTKLPNRVLYRDRMDVALTQAKRNQTKVALILLDMNRFKLVNDSLGIAAGDKLLLEVAKRLKTCVRDSDTLGRMGGDEFSLMLTDVNSHEDILKLIEKITQILEKPFIINGNNVHVSFSMGTAIFPDDGGDRETLIAEANTAIYHIKRKGNNDHAFFSDYSHNFTKETLSLENEIRIALQEDQFEIYFQPPVQSSQAPLVTRCFSCP